MVKIKTREKGYGDYGFSNEEGKLLRDYCKREGFSEFDTLLNAAISSNPAIAVDIFYSLVNGLSYEKICEIKYIPYGKGDFYGYQRRCLAIFRNFLLLYGKWR